MHTCPECGQACSCVGDVEDHDTGDEFYEECEHFLVCGSHDEEQDDGPFQYDEDDCQHCGATWRESVDCAMNGCPMGTNKHRFPESDGPDNSQADGGSNG